MTWFGVWIQINLVLTWFGVWIQINLVFVSGGACKIDFLKSGDRNGLYFSVGGEINLVLCGG